MIHVIMYLQEGDDAVRDGQGIGGSVDKGTPI